MCNCSHEPQQMLTVKQVASLLALSIGTIYNWQSLGKMPPKVNGRYRAKDIAWFQENGNQWR